MIGNSFFLVSDSEINGNSAWCAYSNRAYRTRYDSRTQLTHQLLHKRIILDCLLSFLLTCCSICLSCHIGGMLYLPYPGFDTHGLPEIFGQCSRQFIDTTSCQQRFDLNLQGQLDCITVTPRYQQFTLMCELLRYAPYRQDCSQRWPVAIPVQSFDRQQLERTHRIKLLCLLNRYRWHYRRSNCFSLAGRRRHIKTIFAPSVSRRYIRTIIPWRSRWQIRQIHRRT